MDLTPPTKAPSKCSHLPLSTPVPPEGPLPKSGTSQGHPTKPQKKSRKSNHPEESTPSLSKESLPQSTHPTQQPNPTKLLVPVIKGHTLPIKPVPTGHNQTVPKPKATRLANNPEPQPNPTSKDTSQGQQNICRVVPTESQPIPLQPEPIPAPVLADDPATSARPAAEAGPMTLADDIQEFSDEKTDCESDD